MERTHRRNRRIMLALGISVVVFSILGLSIGRYSVPLEETLRILTSNVATIDITWTAQMYNVVMNVRFPRVIANILVGSALALSGASYQGLFQNPLVSPDILGVAAGACLGAAVGILSGVDPTLVQVFALAGGLAAVFLTTLIPKLLKNKSTLMLVLSGVVISGLMGSLLGLAKYLADPDSQLAAIVFWTMGSFAGVGNHHLARMTIPIVVTVVVLLLYRWRFNLLALGDSEAQTLGLNVRVLRAIVIVCATVLTASAVSVSGTIGWVGLIIPHLARTLVGQDYRYVLPTSLLLGASFMIVVDLLARNLSASEIPISILTGVIGAPLFVLLLLRQKTRIE